MSRTMCSPMALDLRLTFPSINTRLKQKWQDVRGCISANLPGQSSGNSSTEIVCDRQPPSGRLPFTVAKNESDYGSLLRPTLPDRANSQYSQSNFTEGLFIDYRHFIQKYIKPRFTFDYGLTYSCFDHSSLRISSWHNHGHYSRRPCNTFVR